MQDYGSRLEGKVAIVTGAGATGTTEDFLGIGQAISILLSRQGAQVLLVCLLYTSPSPRD